MEKLDYDDGRFDPIGPLYLGKVDNRVGTEPPMSGLLINTLFGLIIAEACTRPRTFYMQCHSHN